MGTSADAANASSSGRDLSPPRGRNRSNSSREASGSTNSPGSHLVLNRPYAMNERMTTLPAERQQTISISPSQTREDDVKELKESVASNSSQNSPALPQPPVRCINPASEVNARLDTQVEVRVYPCNNSQSSSGKKKFTSFTVKPEVSFVGILRYRCIVTPYAFY